MARLIEIPPIEDTIHVVPSEFPRIIERTGEVIADELCNCGHNRSEHYDQGGVVMDGEIIGFYGHGGCSIDGCQCNHYRWERFIYQEGEEVKVE
jgi:hypothetical protein